MGKLYHGLANPRGFRTRGATFADFLPQKHVRAYLLRMASAGRKTIAVALAAVLVLLSVTSTSRAAHGKVDAFVVRDKIRKDLPKINRCYESALRYEPELAGKVKVRFAVMRKGYVKGVQVVENTTGHPGMERCVARVVSAIRFPSRRTGKSLRFTFPFVFAPQD
jgi:TonB family protein